MIFSALAQLAANLKRRFNPTTLPELEAAIASLARDAAARGIQIQPRDMGGFRSEADTAKAIRYRRDDYAAYVAAVKKANPNATPLGLYDAWDGADPRSQRGGRPRPIAAFGSSFHNFGAAVDLEPAKPYPAGKDYHATLRAIGELAPRHGLRWGGLWPGSKNDPWHFELALPLGEARRRWEARRPPGSGSAGGAGAGIVLLALAVGAWYWLRHGAGWRSLS